MNKWATQGRLVIEELKKRPMTYNQMLAVCPGYTPWKRVSETLREGEQIVKGKSRDGWTTWRVVKA